jgi:hypothetical protein
MKIQEEIVIITIKYTVPLSQKRFNEFCRMFAGTDSSLGIWGNPIIFGKKKIHIYGVDKKFWKQVFIELTDKHLVAGVESKYAEDLAMRLIKICQTYAGSIKKAYIRDKEINLKEAQDEKDRD